MVADISERYVHGHFSLLNAHGIAIIVIEEHLLVVVAYESTLSLAYFSVKKSQPHFFNLRLSLSHYCRLRITMCYYLSKCQFPVHFITKHTISYEIILRNRLLIRLLPLMNIDQTTHVLVINNESSHIKDGLDNVS